MNAILAKVLKKNKRIKKPLKWQNCDSQRSGLELSIMGLSDRKIKEDKSKKSSNLLETSCVKFVKNHLVSIQIGLIFEKK